MKFKYTFIILLILPFFGVTQAPGDDCGTATVLNMPTVEGDVLSTGLQSTCALTNVYGNANYCNDINVDGGGYDGVYTFNVATTTRYDFRLLDGDTYKTFALHSACVPDPSNCVASFETGSSTAGEVSVELAPGDYYVFIDREDECCGFLCLGTCDPCREFTLEAEIYNGNAFCTESDPFCSDSPITFPAGVNSGTAEAGPDYGCLTTQPNPAWYYLEIDQSGDLNLEIVPSPLRDIDFVIWGPFPDVSSACTGDLTASCTTCPSNTSGSSSYPYGNLVDCSFDPQSTEQATITGAVAGETYIMMITNYSNQATNISVNQTGGGGSTDCSIVIPCQVEVEAGTGGEICLGDNIQLNGSFTNPLGNTTYEWTSTPTDAVNDLDAVDVLNPIFTPSFDYGEVTFVLSVTDDGPTDPCTVTDLVVVTVNDLPEEPVVSSNTPICEGENAVFDIQGNPDYTVTYSLDGGGTTQTVQLDNAGQAQVVVNAPTSDQTILISEVTNDTCDLTGLSISETVVVNPLPAEPTLTVNTPICEGETATFVVSGDAGLEFTYTIDGGTTTPTATLDGSGEFSLELTNLTTSTTFEVTDVTDGTCSITSTGLEEEVVVNPLPTLTSVITNSPICPNNDATFQINGDAGMDVTYTLDGGATQTTITLDGTGTFEVIEANATSDVTIVLLEIDNGDCQVTLNNEEHTVTVDDLPNAPTVTTNSPICEGQTASFNLDGEPGLTVTYTINGGANQSIVLDGSGQGTIDVNTITENQLINLVEISFGSCSEIVDLSAEVEMLDNPTEPTLSSNSPVCEGETAIFTIEGQVGETITYSLDGGITSNQITIGASGSETVEIANLTQDETIQLTNVSNGSCDLAIALEETINMLANPIAPTLTSNGPVCEGEDVLVTISGDAGLEVTYEVDGVSNTATIPASGDLLVEELNASSSVTVTVTNVSNGDCSLDLSLEEVVEVNALPTATMVVPGAEYCDYETPQDISFAVTGDGPWELTYTLDGVQQTATGSSSPINVGNLTGDYEFTLISDDNCSQALSVTTRISIKPSPDAPNVPESAVYCVGEDIEGIEVQNPQGDMEWYADESLTDFIGISNLFFPEEIQGTTVYYVVSNLDDCESFAREVEVTFEVCDIELPTAFTPNGDGINDVWELPLIDELYPNSIIKVFTRWGDLIFEHDGATQGAYMTNPWDGKYKGNLLPVGSYLFIIEYNDAGGNVLNGTVTILND